MAVIRRPGSPYYHVEFEFKGRRYRCSAKTKSRRVAEDYERRLRQQVYDQVMLGVTRPEVMTLAAAVQRYETGHLAATERRERTAKAIKHLHARLTRLLGPDTPLDQITTPVVAGLRDRLVADGAKPGTVNRYLACLRAVLRMAHLDWGVLARVPRIKLFTLRNARTRWLDADEERRLLAACECRPHLHDLVVFLLDTGTRLGEAVHLQWQHVTRPEEGCGTIRVVQSKSGRPREVPLTRRADALLRGLASRRPEDTDRVFLVRTAGTAWRGTTAQAVPFANPHGAWRAAVRRAELADVRMHDLRHTYASRLVQREVPLHTVSRLLGHESLKMTLRYSHLATADLRRAVAVLDTPPAAPEPAVTTALVPLRPGQCDPIAA